METQYIHGVSPEEQGRLSLLNRLTNQAFLEFLEVHPYDQVLEMGSGLGIMAQTLAATYPTISVTGIEYSGEQLAQCPPATDRLSFVQGDAHRLPFEDNTFEVVYGRYILEHVRDPLLVLAEAYRVLKAGGRLFVQENTISLFRQYPECPTFDQVWNKFIRLQTQLGGDAEIGKKLFSYCHKTGFEQVVPSFAQEIHYAGKDTWIPWIDNLMGNIRGAMDQLTALGYCEVQEIEQALAELHRLKQQPDGSSYFYWNRVQAVKPPAG